MRKADKMRLISLHHNVELLKAQADHQKFAKTHLKQNLKLQSRLKVSLENLVIVVPTHEQYLECLQENRLITRLRNMWTASMKVGIL